MSDQAANIPVFSTYLYTGPVQSVALKSKDATGKDVVFFEKVLHPGKSYDLPDGHSTIEAWKAMKLITPKTTSEGEVE